MRVEQYEDKHKALWDDFVAKAKNGTFLFYRDYMEYHKDRFEDCSLLFFEKEKLIALLPANTSITGFNTMASHDGLTFGGIISDNSMNVSRMERVFKWMSYNICFTKLIYKTVPHIYHRAPAEEDLWVLLKYEENRIVHRDALAVIDYQNRLIPDKNRRNSIMAARRKGLRCESTSRLDYFWGILTQRLANKEAAPVHNFNEMNYLMEKFPIQLYGCYNKCGTMVAGAIVYEYKHVAKLQYAAASDEGKGLGATDMLLDWLVDRYSQVTRTTPRYRYFDFGSSNSASLLRYKERFGARVIVHDRYEVNL